MRAIFVTVVAFATTTCHIRMYRINIAPINNIFMAKIAI